MRLVTFEAPDTPGRARLGLQMAGVIVDVPRAGRWAQSGDWPPDMQSLLDAGPAAWERMRHLETMLAGEPLTEMRDGAQQPLAWRVEVTRLRSPLPRPRSLRDFYAFEEHVRNAFAIREQAIPEEWYRAPGFYFSNAQSVIGPGQEVAAPRASRALDYELEVAAVVGSPGRDIRPEEAEAHIFGYTILNDWSARDIQRTERSVGLGPAKGKDFATSLGPCIVTPDELASSSAGRPGVYDLEMQARVNGTERSRGNWKDMCFSFGELLAQASADADLVPGDVIGSGTVGRGCLLELTRGQGPWLQPGDEVELEIERIGVLKNTVVAPSPLSRSAGEGARVRAKANG
ncbi:MAG TPA: fumarylacetoacetate hydrolase family protein [Anaerolineales bacterium]|nr:fumarylacetoacetate hydrolase family protein [Anaerolineales bacterium]